MIVNHYHIGMVEFTDTSHLRELCEKALSNLDTHIHKTAEIVYQRQLDSYIGSSWVRKIFLEYPPSFSEVLVDVGNKFSTTHSCIRTLLEFLEYASDENRIFINLGQLHTLTQWATYE